MGLRKGRADMEFNIWGKTYFIEMKTPDGIQTPEQKEWQKLVEAHGFEYYICKGLEEFKKIIAHASRKRVL